MLKAQLAVFIALVSLLPPPHALAQGPYQATGIKVGEVGSDSAIVWTRLTRNAARNPADLPMVTILQEPRANGRGRRVVGVEYPNELGVAGIRDAVPGADGEVRVLYRPRRQDPVPWQSTTWQAVDSQRDYTRQFLLNGLEPATQYELQVESRQLDGTEGQSIEGGFRTAPRADQEQRVVFTVVTGQAYPDKDRPDGYEIYPSMLELNPDFFVHTGDIVYYDQLAKNADLARYHWQRTYSLPTNVGFHNRVASYFMKDDHDVLQNDCWPSMRSDLMFELTFEQGQAIFREQVPMGELTYRTRRWGRDLQIWLVEGRDYRSANNAPDGPEKTIWGSEQKAWLKRSMEQSDATFRVLISPTPIVGPDRANKNDNHSNEGFQHEGQEVRSFLAGLDNAVVICGDRHWQYYSRDPQTGLREYSCGPASDQHAGGWRQDDFRPEYHQYLKVKGGFLSATVDRQGGVPVLAIRWHDVQGRVNHEEVVKPGEAAPR